MKKIIFYCILLVNTFQIACSQNKEQITVEQVPSNYSTILFINSGKDGFDLVKFFLTFDISKNTDEQIDISFPTYIYAGKLSRDLFKSWTTVIPLYFNQNNTLEMVLKNKELGKIETKPKEYVFLTSHNISQDSSIQSLFKPYLDRMKSENKDTLHIGTISELKAENSPILQALEGDSLILSFGRNDIYIDPIPVQIK